MTDFVTLAAAIASQLDGVIAPSHGGRDSAPFGDDIRWIDLQNERAGLRVVLRTGADANRLRASMAVTADCKGDADYREVPDFHTLATAAAMSRGADVIARQIESKIVQPAIPMLDGWRNKQAEQAAYIERKAAAVAKWRKAFPTARIDWRGGYRDDATFSLFGKEPHGYVRGTISEDGGLWIDRCSRAPDDIAIAFVRGVTGA